MKKRKTLLDLGNPIVCFPVRLRWLVKKHGGYKPWMSNVPADAGTDEHRSKHPYSYPKNCDPGREREREREREKCPTNTEHIEVFTVPRRLNMV